MFDRVESPAGTRRARRAGAALIAAALVVLARPVGLGGPVAGAAPARRPRRLPSRQRPPPRRAGPARRPRQHDLQQYVEHVDVHVDHVDDDLHDGSAAPRASADGPDAHRASGHRDRAAPPPEEEEGPETTTTEDDGDDEVALSPQNISRTFTTNANLLIQGDGTPGAESTTTTARRPVASEGSSADEESRMIWMIIAGLSGLALLVALLTWRYWLLTRPGLDVRRRGRGRREYPGPGGPGGGRRPMRSSDEWAPPTRSGPPWDAPTAHAGPGGPGDDRTSVLASGAPGPVARAPPVSPAPLRAATLWPAAGRPAAVWTPEQVAATGSMTRPGSGDQFRPPAGAAGAAAAARRCRHGARPRGRRTGPAPRPWWPRGCRRPSASPARAANGVPAASPARALVAAAVRRPVTRRGGAGRGPSAGGVPPPGPAPAAAARAARAVVPPARWARRPPGRPARWAHGRRWPAPVAPALRAATPRVAAGAAPRRRAVARAGAVPRAVTGGSGRGGDWGDDFWGRDPGDPRRPDNRPPPRDGGRRR